MLILWDVTGSNCRPHACDPPDGGLNRSRNGNEKEDLDRFEDPRKTYTIENRLSFGTELTLLIMQ